MPTTSVPVASNVAFFAKTTLVSFSGRIIFNQTSVNIGSGYNTGSGLFTCPHAGIYMFAFGIDSHGHSVQTYLIRNGRAVGVAAITDPKLSSIDDSSTAFAVLRLNTNDEVVVQRAGSQDPNNGFFAGWQISPLDSKSLVLCGKHLFDLDTTWKLKMSYRIKIWENCSLFVGLFCYFYKCIVWYYMCLIFSWRSSFHGSAEQQLLFKPDSF